MAQQLREHTAPADDLSLIPSTHGGWFATPLTPAPAGNPAPALHRHLHTQAHLQTQIHTCAHIIKKLDIDI